MLPIVQGHLTGENGFSVIETSKDPIKLIGRIKRVCMGFEAHKQPIYALVQATSLHITFIHY